SDLLLVVGEEHPCLAGFFEDIVVIFVDRVGELVAAQILPDVFDRVELGCVGRLVLAPHHTKSSSIQTFSDSGTPTSHPFSPLVLFRTNCTMAADSRCLL